MTGKTTQLRACPFCGGTEIEIHPVYDGGIKLTTYQVGCTENGCLGNVFAVDGEMGYPITADFNTAREAIAAWNTRAPITEQDIQRVAERLWMNNHGGHLWEAKLSDRPKSKRLVESVYSDARAALQAFLEG